ncbi:MAG: hypothetical protein CVU95_03660 [Firmicutes bacterium HGW-Firmicutes-2]|jgi:two-component system response regulator YesN|nr:MAG: hypothetical protein CVU95_03660 [Firmicutes bacterium HGW-Firmicutes-2]
MYKVLIVEDELPVRDAIISIINWEILGFEVVYAAEDGQDALNFLEDHEIDLMITDIYMPFIDGLELVRRVRKNDKYCKVVFLTGYNEFEYAKEAITLNANKYLLKPITKDELTTVLEEIRENIHQEITERNNMSRLKLEYEKRREYLQDKLLYDVLLGFIPRDRVVEACQELGVNTAGAAYVVGVIEIMNKKQVGEAVWGEDYSLLHFALYNICKEIIADYPRHYVLMGDHGKIIVCFISDEETKNYGKAYEILGEMLISIRHIYNMDVVAGMGECYMEFSDFQYSFQDALTALEYKVIEGANQIIVKTDIERSSGKGHRQSNEFLEQIEVAIRVNNMDNLSKYIHLYFDMLKFNKVQLGEFKSLVLTLITRIFATFNQLIVDKKENIVLDFYLVEELLKINDLNLIQEKIIQKCEELIKQLEQKREDDKAILVFQGIQYIESYYDDSNLDLSTICEVLHVSSSYFARIFKLYKNQTFLEYLTMFRMEKAKELLKNSTMKVFEISVKVGYDDPHYFSYNFRKNVGMTPSHYRKE